MCAARKLWGPLPAILEWISSQLIFLLPESAGIVRRQNKGVVKESPKILILENDPININLLENELDQSLKGYTTYIVQTEKEYEEALHTFMPDIILSDYSIPTFDWNAAFKLKQKVAPEIPFILVAGTGDGEEALELIRTGVTEYVFKNRPQSLVPKIKWALTEAGKREIQRNERKSLQDGIANLRAIFENTEVGFLFLGPEYDVIAYNHICSHWAANIFSVKLQENANFKDLLLPERFTEFNDFARSILQGNILSYEATYLKTDSSQMWVFVNGKPIMDAGKKVLGICIAITDITHRKMAEEELRKRNSELEKKVEERTVELTEANTALEAFSYSVSHDLRAPVRSVMGFSKIINTDHCQRMNKELKELFGHIETSSRRMNTIIDDLLVLAKYGKEKLNMQHVDITALFNSVWDNLLFTTPHSATLEMQQLPFVYADGSMMQQVLVNLLSNAIKYSSKKEKPHVAVSFKETAETVTIYVRDNGAGFDMRFYDRLFGAFQRLHGITDFEGTGVGLMLVKRIIERHAGTVGAESELNEGATFYFTLPKQVGGK